MVVIADLECTAWDGAAARGWSGPEEHREVVQLGAALVETELFTELVSVKFGVRPKINPVLSQYFINLTHITQEEIDAIGLDFPTFLRMFSGWCADFEIYCFDKVGSSQLFDRDVLMENCQLLGLKFPFKMKRFHNVNEIFREHGVEIRQSGAAPEAFGIDLPARPHDALNDVKGLIVGLRALALRQLRQMLITLEMDIGLAHLDSKGADDARRMIREYDAISRKIRTLEQSL